MQFIFVKQSFLQAVRHVPDFMKMLTAGLSLNNKTMYVKLGRWMAAREGKIY